MLREIKKNTIYVNHNQSLQQQFLTAKKTHKQFHDIFSTKIDIDKNIPYSESVFSFH